MKALLVFVLAVSTSLDVFAKTPLKPFSERVFEVKQVLDENGDVIPEITGGRMLINDKVVQIQLYGNVLCSTPDAQNPVPDCMIPTVVDVDLDIQSVTKTGCGDVYSAEENKMPVDGAHTILNVVDYTTAQCKMFFENAAEASLTIKHYKKFTAEIAIRQYNIQFAQSFN